MLNIPCPWCGLRAEIEFSAGGEAEVIRPEAPLEITDEEWADYLYNKKNIKGWHRERWYHTHGCRRWFNLERNTITHEIRLSWTVTKGCPEADLLRADNSVEE